MTDLEKASLKLYRKTRKKIPIGKIGDPVMCSVQDEVEDLIRALDREKISSELSRAAEMVKQAYLAQREYTRSLQELAARARASGKSMSNEISEIPYPDPISCSISCLCDALERYMRNEGTQGLIS